MVEKRSRPGMTGYVDHESSLESAVSDSDSDLTPEEDEDKEDAEPEKVVKRKTKADTAGVQKLEKKEVKIKKRSKKADTANDIDPFAGLNKEEKKKLKAERKQQRAEKREKKRLKKEKRESEAAERTSGPYDKNRIFKRNRELTAIEQEEDDEETGSIMPQKNRPLVVDANPQMEQIEEGDENLDDEPDYSHNRGDASPQPRSKFESEPKQEQQEVLQVVEAKEIVEVEETQKKEEAPATVRDQKEKTEAPIGSPPPGKPPAVMRQKTKEPEGKPEASMMVEKRDVEAHPDTKMDKKKDKAMGTKQGCRCTIF